MMPDTQVNLEISNGVATATLETADGLNVLSGGVLDALADAAQEVQATEGVRAFVLAARGKVFIAGANIKELAGLDAAGGRAMAERGNRAFDAIAALPLPTIARIHGAALGGGLEVALACDFRLALSHAKVGLPETSLGLVPGWKGIGRLCALTGPTVAKRLMFSAAAIPAMEAVSLGFIDEAVEDETQLDIRIEELIASFRRGGPRAIGLIKRAMATGDEVAAFGDCFGHEESKEGMTAFAEKRPASWTQ